MVVPLWTCGKKYCYYVTTACEASIITLPGVMQFVVIYTCAHSTALPNTTTSYQLDIVGQRYAYNSHCTHEGTITQHTV